MKSWEDNWEVLRASTASSGRQAGTYGGHGIQPIACALFIVPLLDFVEFRLHKILNQVSGAESNAVIFSLIQTASENGLDPYRCLTWLLSSAPEMDLAQPDVVQALLPWNAPASCNA